MRLSLLGVFALLSACTGTKSVNLDSGSGSGSDFVDADEDGYEERVDCDDLDAAVNPGADETWYDGVDQDCDGADDDQDGDGYALADDCDDADPSVHPDAGEVLDDGVDQDCDGADATGGGGGSDDADGDGYGSGVDCDDADASVNPGADETWYDGVDQDCDGADDDQDGDGYALADDCDDTDADSFPGASETTGDGVDQDCSGGDTRALSALAAGDLLLSELMVDPDAINDTYGEWFEVVNASGEDVDLEGLVVTAELSALSFTVVGSLPVAAGGRVVFGREGDPDVNGGVALDYDYRGDLSLDNDAETLTLSHASTTFDSVAYDTSTYFPSDDGYSMSLDEDFLDPDDNDEGQYWCAADAAMSSGDFGTPGEENDGCSGMDDGDGDGWVSAWDCDDDASSVHPEATETARDDKDSDCDGADYEASALRTGELVLSEIMYDPNLVSDTDGEYFEVYNATSYDINLLGLVVTNDSTYATLFTVEEDLVLASGDYAVFGVEADSTLNGGVTVDYDYPGSDLSLSNSADTLYLLIPSGSSYSTVDRVAYDEASGWPSAKGYSIELMKTKLSSTSNDNASNWCKATSHIGGVSTNDYGSPGSANGC